MALSNLTKVQTVGIGSNIEVVGVITTGQFKSGTSNLHSTGVELTNLNVSGIATIGGNLSIGGTLTYQDVTNIDSVGLITARNGINVSGGNVTITNDIDVDGHTNLDNVSIAGVTTITGASGTLLQVNHTAGSGGQGIIRTKASQANSSSFIRAEDSGSTYIGLLKYGTGHSAYGALGAGDGAIYANSGGGNDTNITIMADSSTGYINFATGGNTERVRITSDGNLAINKTANINAKLHIGDTGNDGALSQLVKLANDSSGSGTGAQINLGAAIANESTAACIGGFYDGTGTSFIIKTAGTYANQSTVAERVRIDSTGNIQIKGTNHATMYFRDDGARYGSIFYDGSNFVTRMPAGDNYQVELLDGTVHTRFNNVNGQSGSGSVLELYGGDNTYMYIRGGTETKPSIYMGGGDHGVDNSRIGARYNLSLACNEDGNQTGRKIIFYDDNIELARITEDNQGSSSAQGCMQTTGPGAIRDYYDMRNIKPDGTTFDYISNDSDGGNTYWEIQDSRTIRLYSTSGGHGGNWMRPVYIRQNGYYYWRCNFRLTTTCGSIHHATSTNNYKYAIRFRFNLHGSGAGNNCFVEHNKQYATSGNCNGNQTSTGSLADGTYVTRTGDAVYITAGTYQPVYFTSGYDGVRELNIYELALIQCGANNSGADVP